MKLVNVGLRTAYLSVLGFLVVIASLGGSLLGEAPRLKQAAPPPIALCYVDAGRTSKLELQIANSSRPDGATWAQAFSKLHDFFDRNNDGVLDEREAAQLPSAFALRQVLWGRFAMQAGAAPLWNDLAVDKNRTVVIAELSNYYRDRGVGDVTVATARVTSAQILHASLMRRLDADDNGRLVERELSNVFASLAALDDNEDGLIGPGELASEVDHYPGVTGTILVDRLPASGASVAREGLFVGESSAFGDVLERDDEIIVDIANDQDADRWHIHSKSGMVWHVRCDKGRLGEQVELALENVESWLQRLDRDRNGIVTAVEVPAAEATRYRDWLNMADRNDDGSLDLDEGRAWLDVQRTVASAHTLLTVLDFGRGLFESLDANHDGGLSSGECRDALPRLREAACITDGALNEAQLPRCLLAIVGNGHPKSPLLSAGNSGPAWFRAMDRNSDGAVSRGEFLGTRASFHRLDQNGDEALTTDEVLAAQRRL